MGYLRRFFLFLDRNFILVAFLVFLLVAAFLIFTNDRIALRGDFPGHLYKAQNQPLTSYLQGWNLEFFGGYMEDVYPNLYHWVLKIILVFLPDTQALQLLTFLLLLFEVFGLLFLVRSVHKEEHLRRISFVLGLFGISILQASQLGSLLSSIYVGGGPASLGFSFFLFACALLTKPLFKLADVLLLGVLLGLSVLTHTISAMGLLIVLLTRSIPAKKDRKQAIEALLLGIIIGLPWIWVAINPDFATSRINMDGVGEGLGIFVVVSLAVIFLSKKFKEFLLFPGMIALSILGVVPLFVSDLLWKWGFSGIHFYRFFIYGFILLIITLPRVLTFSIKEAHLRFLALFILAFGLFLATTFRRDVALELDEGGINQISGRILDISGHTPAIGVPNTLEHTLAERKGIIGSEGLFFESSEVGILFYSLENSISRLGFTGGIDTILLRKFFGFGKSEPRYKVDPEKINEVLGVNWYIETNPEKVDAKENQGKVFLGRIIEKLKDYSIGVNIFGVKASDKPLVEPLSYIPKREDKDFRQWWNGASLENLYLIDSPSAQDFDEFVSKHNLDKEEPVISDIKIGKDWITYEVGDSNGYGPVFVKFTYNRYFKAKADNFEVPIARVSPGYMLVPSRGHVEIRWEMPRMLRIFERISVAVLLGIVGGLMVIRKR